MSSRILARERTAEVPPYAWRNVGTDGVIGHHRFDAPSTGTPDRTFGPLREETLRESPLSPSGPTWEQYHALEVRLREAVLSSLAPPRDAAAGRDAGAAGARASAVPVTI